ncbi:MAG: hypothetical protein WC371_04410, partial [Parachlamydiales bacterium]
MKKAHPYLPLVFLASLLFFGLSLERPVQEKIRSLAIGALAPSWSFLNHFHHRLAQKKAVSGSSAALKSGPQEKKLLLENQLLKNQSRGIYDWLTFDQRIDEQLERLKTILKAPVEEAYWQAFFQRRAEALRQIL